MKQCILFYVKYPKKGYVKTRLAKNFGEEETLKLYRCFVEDMMLTLEHVQSDIRICFTPEDKKKAFQKWLGNHHSFFVQKGKDLGERLKNSFIEAFNAKYDRVIVLGSDSPDLPAEMVTEAFEKLETHDVVIGPAEDGGYYLLGFKKEQFTHGVFDNISWSTKKVFQETINKLKRKNVCVLPTWTDIDTLDDLKKLVERNQKTKFSKSKTMQYASKIIKKMYYGDFFGL
ncbi:hypothetical protein COV18_05565 [Candidatus Woesearchaeota archaeon CG10_big_fil_rev_8_21_14_0_10_37_12]|nr:MAG: hypothetical protein COV18_05565 [Candidatus Woesearchaeota archaeon CG10_big_fil_rev_8_21_14_0_10_37_12]